MKNVGISVNVRLLTILVILGLIFSAGIFFLHRYQLKRQSDFFLTKARAGAKTLDDIEDPIRKAEEAQDIGNLFARYLVQNQDDLEVAQELALLHFNIAKEMLAASVKEKDDLTQQNIRRYGLEFFGAAVIRLEDILRKNTDQTELRKKLIDILFQSGNWKGSVEHIKHLCNTPDNVVELAKLFDRYDLWKRLSFQFGIHDAGDEALNRFISSVDNTVDSKLLLDFLGDDLWILLDDSNILSTYASCCAMNEKYAAAEKSLEKAIAIAPDNIQLYERLAYLLASLKPPRNADADYWVNEMVYANPDFPDARIRRGRYWNHAVLKREKDQHAELTEAAVCDALAAMQKAATIIADEADRQVPSLPETKALKQALSDLPDKPPTANDKVASDYQIALIAANKSAAALKDKLDGISEAITACRDGLRLAAQSKWLNDWLARGTNKDFIADAGNEKLDDARVYANALVQSYPHYSFGYSVLAEIEQQSGDREKAIAVLRKGSKLCDNNANLLWRLTSLLIDGGHVAEAKAVCGRLEEEDAESYIVDHLRARIAFLEGRWLEAAEGFESVRDKVVTRWPSQAKLLDYLLAECYGRLGRIDQQRNAYFRAASTDRTWLPAMLGIAETKAKAGQIDEAIEDYRLIQKLNNAPVSSAITLVKLLITQNMLKTKAERDWIEPAKIIDSLEESKIDPLQVMLLRADLYKAQGQNDQASAICDQLLAGLEKETQFLQLRLEEIENEAIKLSENEKNSVLEQADELRVAIKQNEVNQASVWKAIADVAQQNKDWEKVTQALLNARDKAGDTVALRLAHGKHLLHRIGKQASEPLRSLAGTGKQFTKEQRLQLWRGLAELSLRAGDYQQAELLSRSVLNEEPGNRQMQIIRFEIAVQKKELDVMQEILDEIKKAEKTPGAFWHYGEAMRLNLVAAQDDVKLLNEAQEHLLEAIKMRPNWPAARLMLAAIYDRQGNLEAAAKNYRKAIDLGVQSTMVIRRAVQLLAGLNRFREADEVLRLLGDRGDSEEGVADFESSLIKAKIGKYEDALALARNAAKNSKKAGDYVWLGQLLSIAGRQAENANRLEESEKMFQEAEDAFEQALVLDSSSNIAWVALIQFYGQIGQVAKAEEAIEKAKNNLPKEKAFLAIAQCYEAAGSKKAAEQQLLNYLKSKPNDPAVIDLLAEFYARNNQSDSAIAQLKKIISGSVPASDEYKSKARRSYATILFRQGGKSNRHKALELIEKNLELDAESQADQYAKAVLLANDLSVDQRKKAIPVLEKLLDEQGTPSAEIQFTLAKLYLSEDRLPDFKNIMRIILRGAGREPRYLAFYIDQLIDSDDLKEADIYLDLLKKSQPDAIGTKKLMAKLAFTQKNYETAIRVLEEFLKSADSDDTNAQVQNKLEVAVLLAGFASTLKQKGGHNIAIAKGFDDKAENIFQQVVDMQPGRELFMAQFLAKQGRLKKALKVLKKHANKATAADIAKTCFVCLQGTSPYAEQLQQIDRILKTALEKHGDRPEAILLKTALAILYDFQGKKEQTEALYREILKESPQDSTAMNNLANFLALNNLNLDEAADLINKAIRHNGYLPELLDTRAVVYLAQQKPKMALEDLDMALKKQPTPIRYFHQAQACLQDGQKKAAVKALEMAHDMGLKENSLIGIERRNYQKLTRALR